MKSYGRLEKRAARLVINTEKKSKYKTSLLIRGIPHKHTHILSNFMITFTNKVLRNVSIVLRFLIKEPS